MLGQTHRPTKDCSVRIDEDPGSLFDLALRHAPLLSNFIPRNFLDGSRKLLKPFRVTLNEFTIQHLSGTSLASVFRDRGYRTAFVTPSDLAWAEWGPFLQGRGFDLEIIFKVIKGDRDEGG